MSRPRVTTDADESMPLEQVPEDRRQAVAEKKLWRIRSILQSDLRVAADYLDEIQRHEAWRLFDCGSMIEFVEQRGLRLDDELLARIRSTLAGTTAGTRYEDPPCRVSNLRHEDLGDCVYVGRASPRRGLPESPFGNPFKEGRDGTRAEVIEKYRRWILDRQDLLQRLHEFRGRRLACWCKPLPCHADVLIELVDADEILDALAAAGVAVEAVDGRLRLSPPSAVDAALRARVAAHKPGILSLLASRPAATLDREPPRLDRRGDDETPEEARSRQAAAIERLRLDRLAFVEEAQRAGVYRDLAAGPGESVP